MSSTSAEKLLLKNGVVLIHDADNHVIPTELDLLIENGTIAKIASSI